MSSQKESAGRGMLAGLIREIDSLEAVIECEDGLTKMGKRTIQNTINWMKDRANSYAKMNAKLNGGATPFPERCTGGVTPFDEGVVEVSERCAGGVPEVYTKEKVMEEKVMEDKPPNPLVGEIAQAWCEVAKTYGYRYSSSSLAVMKGARRLVKDGYPIEGDMDSLRAGMSNFLGGGYPVKSLEHFARDPVAMGAGSKKPVVQQREEAFMDSSVIDGLVGGFDF